MKKLKRLCYYLLALVSRDTDRRRVYLLVHRAPLIDAQPGLRPWLEQLWQQCCADWVTNQWITEQERTIVRTVHRLYYRAEGVKQHRARGRLG